MAEKVSAVDMKRLNQRFYELLKPALLEFDKIVELCAIQNKDGGQKEFIDEMVRDFRLSLAQMGSALDLLTNSFGWPEDFWLYREHVESERQEILSEAVELAKRHGRLDPRVQPVLARANSIKSLDNYAEWFQKMSLLHQLERNYGDDFSAIIRAAKLRDELCVVDSRTPHIPAIDRRNAHSILSIQHDSPPEVVQAAYETMIETAKNETERAWITAAYRWALVEASNQD